MTVAQRFKIISSLSLSLSLSPPPPSQNFTSGFFGGYLDHWEVLPNDVVMEKFIGEGSYGEVYRGCLTKRIGKKENKIVVLVKYLRSKFSSLCNAITQNFLLPSLPPPLSLTASATDTEYREFNQQLQQYKISSAGEDPFILRILGCISATQPSCAIMEYPEGGDLLTHLVRLREEVPSPSLKYWDDTMVLIEPGVDLVGSLSLSHTHTHTHPAYM